MKLVYHKTQYVKLMVYITAMHCHALREIPLVALLTISVEWVDWGMTNMRQVMLSGAWSVGLESVEHGKTDQLWIYQAFHARGKTHNIFRISFIKILEGFLELCHRYVEADRHALMCLDGGTNK